jgi:hypothetical protein
MTKAPPGPRNGLLGLKHLRAFQRDILGFARDLQRDYGDCAAFASAPRSSISSRIPTRSTKS